jgi:hypothetical protein
MPAGVGQWHVAAGLWVAVPNAAMTASPQDRAASRIDDSPQVRADDLVNYLRGPGVSLLQANGQIPNRLPMAAPPFPDWDGNLDGKTSLGDIGVVASKWGHASGCPGWIRAGADNSNNVTLADVGTVTSKWGLAGYSCAQCSDHNFWSAIGGEYSYGEPCAADDDEIDPITTILISGLNGVEPVRQQVESHFTAVGLEHGYWEWLGVPIIGHQHYLESGQCMQGELTQSTADQRCGPWPHVACAEKAWHVRCNVVDHAAVFGYWVACTPHWDEVSGTQSCQHHGLGSGHFVPSVWAGHGNEEAWGSWDGSGFDAARDWLWFQLVASEGHQFLGWMDFRNTRPMQQCNGEWTQADGKVNIIRLNF